MIKIKRIYDRVSKNDGFRMLVDRLWPRGISKAKAKIDLWLKEVAPSDNLRKWFGHDPDKCGAFREKYFSELREKQKVLDQIRTYAKTKTVTLLYAAKEDGCNNAAVLEEFIKKLKTAKKQRS